MSSTILETAVDKIPLMFFYWTLTIWWLCSVSFAALPVYLTIKCHEGKVKDSFCLQEQFVSVKNGETKFTAQNMLCARNQNIWLVTHLITHTHISFWASCSLRVSSACWEALSVISCLLEDKGYGYDWTYIKGCGSSGGLSGCSCNIFISEGEGRK